MAFNDIISKFEYAHIQLLPEFDGTASCSLDYFLARSESFLRNFQRPEGAPQAELINEFFFNVIKSKLKGDARSILDVEANSSYNRLKEKLMRKYGDMKDERLLLKEISNCYQKLSEPYADYHERLCSLVLRYTNLCKINYQAGILGMKLKEIEELGLNTFKSGLLEPYRSYLRYCQVADLDSALRSCRSYDNEKAYDKYIDQLRFSHKQPHPSYRSNYEQVPLPNPFVAPIFSPRQRPQNQNFSRAPMQGTSQAFSNQNRMTPLQAPQYNHPPDTRQAAQISRPTGQIALPPRPVGQGARPYPTPTNIGRRFTPQDPSRFPRPMSGVSTIRGNLNTHYEPEDEFSYLSNTCENAEDSYDIVNDYEYCPENDQSYLPTDQFDIDETNQQDFHKAQSSRSKT